METFLFSRMFYEICSEKFSDKFFEISSLINLYNNMIYSKKEPVTIAPNKLLLNIFGGHLTIEQYRKILIIMIYMILNYHLFCQ